MRKIQIVGVLAVLAVLTACSVDQVLADINIVLQTASAIGQAVGNVSSSDSAEIAKFTQIATEGINAVKADYDTYKQSGASGDLDRLRQAILSVQTNLTQELAAAHITDPKSIQKVTAWVNLVSSTVAAIEAALPQTSGGVVAKASRVAKTLPTAKQIKAGWDVNVCQGDLGCTNLVH